MTAYQYIPFDPGKRALMRRLGSTKAQLSTELEQEIDKNCKLAARLFHAKGKDIVLPIVHIDEESFSIEGKVIVSRLLTKLLKDSNNVYLMCTSLPESEVAKISEAMKESKGLRAIVLDAYASEYVDGALSVMMKRKNEALRRTGQKLTKHRFSAGYGDLDIKYQGVFFDFLDMGTLEVKLNENFLMEPEKSVIAIAGIESYKAK